MGSKFFINDNQDLLIEILKRLDGRSLGVAACVCKQWCAITRDDSLWEHLCFRHVSPPPDGVRTVVLALGGYRRLYMVCVRPVLNRLRKWKPIGMESASDSEVGRRVYWTRHEVELSLSLFCVDYYERVLLGGGGGGGGGGRHGDAACTSSLMFLCNAVNV
ncbi:F-box protein SNE-like [Nicotiana tabacum]|uniref:F-box protein SNE-like n=1 Tax=Nicotiana tabacum TaxID=4097 RepID=A0A1S3XXA5_TOBAC|nr:PREDICTED: F-box protein SNE-like [Nicotiana tabacum]